MYIESMHCTEPGPSKRPPLAFIFGTVEHFDNKKKSANTVITVTVNWNFCT